MKYLTLTLLLLTEALLASPPVQSFSGNWELDSYGSRGLPQSIKDLRYWRLEVTATERELRVKFRIKTAFADEPEIADTLTFPLDGSSRKVESTVAGVRGEQRVPTTVSGQRQTNGDLDLRMTRQIPWGSDTAVEMTTEKWRLWRDGALWIRFHRETPLFKTDYDLRFVRKGTPAAAGQ